MSNIVPPIVAQAQEEVANNRSLSSSFNSRRRDKDVRFQVERDYAIAIIRNNVKAYQNCDPATLQTALLDLAATGLTLSPRLAMAYLIPYGNQITLEIGYRGMEHMCYRSGQLKMINCAVVRKGDHFVERHTEMGPGFEHIPKLHETADQKQLPPIIGAYCMAHFTNGGRHYERIDGTVFERAKQAAMKKNRTDKVPFPYVLWPEEMWKKICVRRGWKHWPKDATLMETMELVDKHMTPLDFGPAREDEPVDGGVLTISDEQEQELLATIRDFVLELYPNDPEENTQRRVDFWVEGLAETMHVNTLGGIPEAHFDDAKTRLAQRIDAIRERRNADHG